MLSVETYVVTRESNKDMRLILVLSITILAGTLDVLAREEIREDIPVYDATSSALNNEELDEDLLLHDEGEVLSTIFKSIIHYFLAQ